MRFFTPDEANARLADVRPAAEEMVARHKALAAAESRRAALLAAIGTNGGDLSPGEVREASETVAREAEALARCVERIHAAGAQVKDPRTGLVDFPALREGEEVCLCWMVGEPEIGYWHPVETGFAGRRPLPL